MPKQIGGALLFNDSYFLGGRARLAFWDRMGQVLPEGAPILMSRAYGVVDTGEELVRTASSTMGRNTYERWRQTVPVKDGRVEITNTYKTIRGGEVVRERRQQPALACAGFVDVVAGEMTLLEHGEDVLVDDRAQRFEKIEGQAVAVFGVGVDDAQTRVEAERL